MEHWARGRQFGRKADFLCISVTGKRTAEQFKSSLGLDVVTLGFVEGRMPRFGQLGCSGFVVLHPDGTIANPRTTAFLDRGEGAFRDLETLLGKLCEADFEWPATLATKSVKALQHLAINRDIDTRACIEKKEIEQAIILGSIAKLSSGKLKKLLQKEGVDTKSCLERQDYVSLILGHNPNQTTPATGTAMPSFAAAMQCPDGLCEKPKKKKKKTTCCHTDAQSSYQAARVASVGNQLIDAEHAECTDAINQLAKNQTPEDLKRVLQVFGDHFRHEEEMMTASGFGGNAGDSFAAITGHTRDHNNMMEKIQKIHDLHFITSIDPKEKVGMEEVKAIAELFERHARSFDALYEGHL